MCSGAGQFGFANPLFVGSNPTAASFLSWYNLLWEAALWDVSGCLEVGLLWVKMARDTLVIYLSIISVPTTAAS